MLADTFALCCVQPPARVQGTACTLDWRRCHADLLALHMATPGLQLRLLVKQEEAAAHIIHSALVCSSGGSMWTTCGQRCQDWCIAQAARHAGRMLPPPSSQALAQQPYAGDSQLEVAAGLGPGTASKAAASAMREDLGPETCQFAVGTLGKMSGMGATKAWVRAACRAPGLPCTWHSARMRADTRRPLTLLAALPAANPTGDCQGVPQPGRADCWL